MHRAVVGRIGDRHDGEAAREADGQGAVVAGELPSYDLPDDLAGFELFAYSIVLPLSEERPRRTPRKLTASRGAAR